MSKKKVSFTFDPDKLTTIPMGKELPEVEEYPVLQRQNTDSPVSASSGLLCRVREVVQEALDEAERSLDNRGAVVEYFDGFYRGRRLLAEEVLELLKEEGHAA